MLEKCSRCVCLSVEDRTRDEVIAEVALEPKVCCIYHC